LELLNQKVFRVHSKARDITALALFAVLTMIGAWYSIPLPVTPIPVTLQVFFVLLSGALLGGRLGGLSQIVYIALGLVGFPVFAGFASGPAVLVGPTGGYLIGFVVGAYVTGKVSQARELASFRWLILATMSGLFPIYLLGNLWLWAWFRSPPMILLVAGILPFLPGDITKAILSAYVASRKQVKQFVRR
jgi:biotin transport system substrate-specific component